MEATTTQSQSVEVMIPEAHREAAERYIAAIVRHEPAHLLGAEAEATRSAELFTEFELNYRRVGHGPYARHGADALRIALGRL